MWQIWIDRGGTFTDLVAKKPNGELVTHKLLSENPEQYEDAALQGIRDLLGLDSGAPIPPGTVESVKIGHHRCHQRIAGTQRWTAQCWLSRPDLEMCYGLVIKPVHACSTCTSNYLSWFTSKPSKPKSVSRLKGKS